MKIAAYTMVYLWLAWLSIGSAAADPFVGSYVGQLYGEEYRLSLQSSGEGQYRGTLTAGGESLPLSARRMGEQLVGQMGGEDEGFEFVCQVQGTTLLLQDEDGETIVFQRSSSTGKASVIQSARQVFVNRIQLDQATLQRLETQSQVPIANGRYWYDSYSGAWGVEGGPTAGFIYAGLPLPNPMPADISGGGTGIFINGREIHPLDQQALYQLFGVTYQGQFWMDSQGNLGYVGGPPIANVLQASQAARSGSGSVTHGYGSASGARGTLGGGMYSGRTASGKSVFWYPGM